MGNSQTNNFNENRVLSIDMGMVKYHLFHWKIGRIWKKCRLWTGNVLYHFLKDFYQKNNRRASYSILQVRATRGQERLSSRRKSTAVFDSPEQKADFGFETRPESSRKDRRRSSASCKSERSIWNSSRRLSVTNFSKEAHLQRIPRRFSIR